MANASAQQPQPTRETIRKRCQDLRAKLLSDDILTEMESRIWSPTHLTDIWRDMRLSGSRPPVFPDWAEQQPSGDHIRRFRDYQISSKQSRSKGVPTDIWNEAPSVEKVLAALDTVEEWCASSRPSKPDIEPNPDGPQTGNRFHYNNKTIDLAPRLWSLLDQMWGVDSRDRETVEASIWGDDVEGDHLKSAMRDLNAKLKKLGYPRRISKVRSTDCLVWTLHSQ